MDTKKVLLALEDSDSLDAIQTILEHPTSGGFEVKTARNVEDAEDLIAEGFIPHGVIVDEFLYGMTAAARLISLIRKEKPGAVIWVFDRTGKKIEGADNHMKSMEFAKHRPLFVNQVQAVD